MRAAADDTPEWQTVSVGRERVDFLQRRPGNVTGVAGMSRGVEMIEGILKECGYELEEARLSAVNGNGRDDTDSPYRAINDYALKNLEAWAKDLPIHRLQRQRGRYASFTGV